jgi:PBP1b-binding outer membrane lipoprotein LpoB
METKTKRGFAALILMGVLALSGCAAVKANMDADQAWDKLSSPERTDICLVYNTMGEDYVRNLDFDDKLSDVQMDALIQKMSQEC